MATMKQTDSKASTMTQTLNNNLFKSVLKENVLLTYPEVLCTIYKFTQRHETIELKTPIYNIDKIPQVTFKIA